MLPQAPSSSRLNGWWSRTRLARSVLTLLIIGASLAFLAARSAPDLLPALRAHPTPTTTPTPTTVDLLAARPLHLPPLASGSPCPTVPGRTVNSGLGPALGDGPVYFASEGTDQGTVQYAPAETFYSQEWGGQKTLYAISPDYQGDVLLRGHQLDGSGDLRFGIGDVPADKQVKRASPDYNDNHWSYAIDYMRMRAPGCYALQADGTTFSEVIIFQAVLHEAFVHLPPRLDRPEPLHGCPQHDQTRRQLCPNAYPPLLTVELEPIARTGQESHISGLYLHNHTTLSPT